MNEDERDNQYVLNNQEAIEEEMNRDKEKGKETTDKINESIDKIEEEQDIDFQSNLKNITNNFMKDIKSFDPENDAFEIEQLHIVMVQKIFEKYIENKQDMLTKIASKIASQNYLDDNDSDEYDDDHNTSRLKPYRDTSFASRGNKNSSSRKGSDNTDMENFGMNDDDSNNNMMEIDDFEKPIGHKRDSTRKRPNKPSSKIDGSQKEFLMNIQTTADLLSFVKKTHKDNSGKRRMESGVSSKHPQSSSPNRLTKRDPMHRQPSRNFGFVQQNTRSVEIQTDDLDILDLRCTEINLSEVYHFDKVSG
jgi:hypothetical protein